MKAIVYTIRVVFYLTVFIAYSLPAYSDELTLYFIEPPTPLDWQTPSALTLSFQKANAADDTGAPIGHIAVDLNCNSNQATPAVRIFDGMTMADSSEVWDALDKGRALGVLIDNYTGMFHGDSYQEQIKEYSCNKATLNAEGKSRLSFLNIKIKPSTCERLVSYYQEYRQRGLDKVYGGLNTNPFSGDPRGASCSVFGMSFLEVAGLYSQEFDKEWNRYLRIPEELMGTPASPISIIKVVMQGHRWASDDQPGVTVKIPDPALMHKWIGEKIKSKDPQYQFQQLCDFSHGVSVDMTNVETPTFPIWQ